MKIVVLQIDEGKLDTSCPCNIPIECGIVAYLSINDKNKAIKSIEVLDL